MFKKNEKNEFIEKIRATKKNSGLIKEKIFYFILNRKKCFTDYEIIKCELFDSQKGEG